MIAQAAVLFVVLFSGGRPAAGSKSFGYGGGESVSVGQKEPETWAGPLVTPDVVPFIPKPDISFSAPEVAVSYGPDDSPPATTPSPKPQVAVSYGPDDSPPATTPSPKTPASNNNKAGYGGSTPQPQVAVSYGPDDPPPATTPSPKPTSNNKAGYGSGTTPSTTPAPADKATKNEQAAPAAASGGGNGKYGLDPAGEPEYGMNQKAIDDILREHNLFRAKEHVPPLSWNATLAKFSQKYAETLKSDCRMVHSTSPYGENLMLGSGGVTWKTTVDEWSDEKKSYHYGSNSCDAGKMCGHYTAVVWKGTTTVGCGRVVCNNGETMIMCSYWPPGNYDGVKPF